jgi:hypothetical protein
VYIAVVVVAELHVIELEILSFAGHQCIMLALLDNLPIDNDNNSVCMIDSGQSMGDYESGPTVNKIFKRFLHKAL